MQPFDHEKYIYALHHCFREKKRSPRLFCDNIAAGAKNGSREKLFGGSDIFSVIWPASADKQIRVCDIAALNRRKQLKLLKCILSKSLSSS